MQVITLKVEAAREGEQVVCDVQYQQKKGEGWNITKQVTVTSGTGEAERKIVVNDDERLVIEGRVTKKVIMDPNQNVAKVVDADDEVRQAQEQFEQAQMRLNKVREEKGRVVNQDFQEAASYARPVTNLGNPVPGTVTPNNPPPNVSPSMAPKTAGDTGQGATDSKGQQGTSTSAPSSQAGGGVNTSPNTAPKPVGEAGPTNGLTGTPAKPATPPPTTSSTPKKD